MRLTAQEIYNKLVNECRAISMSGKIHFNMGNVGGSSGIVVRNKDVVGDIIQTWFEEWMREQNIEFDLGDNTQMPPDMYLNPDDHTRDLLEIKAFNYEANPAFDIADFKTFVNELIRKPYYLGADFLILGYIMNKRTGEIMIRDVWLKKIWEITRPMKNWPITLQYKNGSVTKMRPANWYSEKRKILPVFLSKEDFLAALEETIYRCSDTHKQGEYWKDRFQRSYRNYYGKNIEFPRWDDIKHRYIRQREESVREEYRLSA